MTWIEKDEFTLVNIDKFYSIEVFSVGINEEIMGYMVVGLDCSDNHNTLGYVTDLEQWEDLTRLIKAGASGVARLKTDEEIMFDLVKEKDWDERREKSKEMAKKLEIIY